MGCSMEGIIVQGLPPQQGGCCRKAAPGSVWGCPVMLGICCCPESSCPIQIKGNCVSGWSDVAPTHAGSPKGFYNKRVQCTESLGGRQGVGEGGIFTFEVCWPQC